MFYVYSRHLSTGKEELIGVYETPKEAVHKIAFCYAIDFKSIGSKDEYYYFMKKH